MGQVFDVLTVDEAKKYLRVDFDDDDVLIGSLIQSAVALVEQTTNYRLYRRDELIYTSKVGYEAFQFPINGVTVISQDSADTTVFTVKSRPQSLRNILFWGNGFWYDSSYDSFYSNDYFNVNNPCGPVYVLTLDVGYDDPSETPNDLVMAVRQLVSYYYENRDMDALTIPSNIDLMLNQYRRFATIL